MVDLDIRRLSGWLSRATAMTVIVLLGTAGVYIFYQLFAR